MANRAKRTYNLSETTVRRVRELAEQYGTFRTQDRVVDAAVERLYLELRERAEEIQWAAAADDPEFRAQAAVIVEAYGDRDLAGLSAASLEMDAPMTNIQRWSIVVVDLDPTVGHERQGVRRVVDLPSSLDGAA